MEKQGHAFYVLRKGDIVAIYHSLSDCQAQVSSSVCDPSVSVYKGYSLRKEAEEYLASRGLKNASYAINAVDVKEDLFGALVPCPFQEVFGSTSIPTEDSKEHLKSGYSMEAPVVSCNHGVAGSNCIPTEDSKNHLKTGYSLETEAMPCNYMSCILEFDGASKGNPGKAGAGAILRTEDGRMLCRLREGLGVVTNNVAEYRGLILGMKYALKKGFKQIRAQGDSQLICMQVQGLWQTKHHNMIDLCKEAKELRNKFQSFKIIHVRRELNVQADMQANLATNLQNCEIQEDPGEEE